MKKLMFFVYSLRMGGSEKACVRMANALTDRYDVTICTVFGNAGLESEVSEKVHLISKFPQFIRGFAKIVYRLKPKRAYRFLVKDDYDIEIAVGDGLESFVISGSPNPNKFSWVHINLGQNGTKRSQESIAKFNAFKKIICVSESNKQAFVKEIGLEDTIVVAYTPIDIAQIQKLADKQEIIFKKKTFVSVGRLEKVKGYDRLIVAVSSLQQKVFQVIIIGDGTQRNELQKKIAENNLSDRVTLLGSMDNPYPYIKAADALICSSYEESFGFTLVEAMCLRTPVITTKCGGVQDIIKKSEQGLICDNSVEGIKEGINRFLKDESEINTEEAYDRATVFNVENCVDAFCRIIDD